MTDETGRCVLAGVDGSDQALRAVEWAAREAHRQGLPLRLVSVLEWPDRLLDPNAVLARRIADTPSGSRYREDLARTAEQRLAAAEAAARDLVPGLVIETALVEGTPVPVLSTEAEHADLVVVGSRGRGGFADLLVGSVAIGLAAEAPCPVVVVRGTLTHPYDAPVLAGFDSRASSGPILEFAFGAASRRQTALEVLFAWRDTYTVPGDTEAEEAARGQLKSGLADVRRRYRGVRVRPLVVSDRPAHALVERSAAAQLVVVGSRGRGGLGGLLLGSVSHALLHHADCPVAVIGPAAGQHAG